MRRDPATGLLYRPGDTFIIEDVRTNYAKLPVKAGDVLLDLGANIGAVSLLALSKGAARIVAVEADPNNIALLRRNLGKRALILWAAVGATAGRLPFYVDRAHPFQSSRVAARGSRRIEVPMVPFAGLLEQYRPTIVKCDIEFGEYDLPELARLPDHVRVLAMEIHVRHRRFAQTPDDIAARRVEAAALLAAIKAQGFKVVRRKDNLVGESEPAADDGTGLAPRLKAVNAIWRRT